MFREVIEKMAPYVPGEQPRPGQRLIKLNTNENPYPPSPRVRRAAIKAAGTALRLYPPPHADEFITAAARLYDLRTDMVVAGNGSDELLTMLFRAALGRGDRVAFALPTYSLYDTLAAIQEARVVAVPFGPDLSLPLEGLARAKARLTIVCNPNSPTGTMARPDQLDQLARRLHGRLLAIDEAYVDFADSNSLDLLKRHRNVIILRSLSKSFSLAGMRLGLCFAAPRIIEDLLKVKDSYNLSRVAIAVGAAALDDEAWMRRNVERVKRSRTAAEKRLRAMGFEVPPSAANFVLARLAGRDLAPLAAALRRGGILVRHFPASVFRDGLRISIGTPTEMAALFKGLESLVKQFHAVERNGRVGR
ncbi:MAG: histidinol-phosphate transaminase [Candidatus Binataceae bacterium]